MKTENKFLIFRYSIFILSLILILILISLPNIVKAETIIYDNLTTNNYKLIKISDDLNYKYLTDYKYEVYINNQFLGYYSKDENIFIPDNSNITIYIPSPIKTDFLQTYDLTKPAFIIVAGFLLTFGILLVFGYIIWKKIRSK